MDRKTQPRGPHSAGTAFLVTIIRIFPTNEDHLLYRPSLWHDSRDWQCPLVEEQSAAKEGRSKEGYLESYAGREAVV